MPDNKGSKSILYGAESIKELRKKFTFFEAQLNRNKAKQVVPEKNKSVSRSTEDSSKKRCYNCGDKYHLGKDCPSKAKGTKCSACGEFGHLSNKCPNGKKSNGGKETVQKTRCDTVSTGDQKVYKEVLVNKQIIKAVIDSGSDLHLCPSRFYVKLGAPLLNFECISFGGVGTEENKTLGRFDLNVVIDDMPITLQVHVIPDNFINNDLLIGGQLSDLVEVRLKRRTT